MVGRARQAHRLITKSVTSGTAVAAPSTDECGPSITNTLTTTPWPLRRLNPPAAWPLSRGDGVIVAVIDSGVSATHPRLVGQLLRGKDFLGSGPGTCDESGHGTVVAGIIAARDTVSRAQGAPFYGVAPGAKILPIRVFRAGRIVLKSNMTLWISPDAVLLGSQDDAEYPLPDDPGIVTPRIGGIRRAGATVSGTSTGSRFATLRALRAVPTTARSSPSPTPSAGW
jgi:subtilisin family serine protease